jgi:DNA primase
MVEGPGDHLVYERLVDNNVVALTTSGVSKFQLRFLRRFAKRIVTVLDMDDAGRKGVKSFNDQYGNEFEIVNLKYPVLQKEKDIGDLWKRLGDDKFRSYFKRALSGA